MSLIGVTEEETQRLQIILQELKSRGVNIQSEIKVAKRKPWPFDSAGYIMKSDGTRYNPTEAQEGFVKSNARFSAFIGGRGCVSPDTLIGNIPIENMTRCWGEVSTIFGNQSSSPSFLKGKDHLYRFQFENGREVKATLSHRVLTPVGWDKLDNLSSQSLVFLDGTWHEPSENEKSLNSQDHYSLNFHLNGVLCSLLEVAFLNILLQLHKIVVYKNALSLYNLLSIVDFYALTLSRLVLAHLTSLISYESLHHHSQRIVQSFCNFLQSDNGKQFLHQNNDIFGLVSPFQYLSQIDGEYDLLDFGNIQRDLLSLEYFVSSLHDPILIYIQGVAQEVVHSLSLDFPDSFLLEHQVPYKFLSLFDSKYQTLSRQELDFESLGIVEQLVSSFDVKSFSSSDFSFLHELPYYNAFFGGLQEATYYKFGEYYDIEIPFGQNYSAEGIYHHNSGKTAAGAQKAAAKIRQGFPGAVLNPDFENFKISTWPEFREWIPWDRVIEKHKYRGSADWEPQQPFTLVFESETGKPVRVLCKGVKDPGSARGPNINWFWYDEGGRDEDGLSWKTAVASVRIGIDPQAFTTTTPKGVDHWIYELFVDEDIPEEAIELFEKEESGRELVEIFYGSIVDNQENLDPGFFASMLATYPKGWLRDQELYGRFVREGGVLGDRSWFDGKILTDGQLATKQIYSRVRYWDLAASEKKISGKKKRNDPDETVGTLMSWNRQDNEFYIEDQVCGHWAWKDVKEAIRDTAKEDGSYVTIYIEQEPAAGGKNQVAELEMYIKDELPGFSLKGHNPKNAGDKIMRANIWFSEAALGMVYLVHGDWNSGFLRQIGSFPELRHDDRIDSASGARHTVAPVKSWARPGFLHL